MHLIPRVEVHDRRGKPGRAFVVGDIHGHFTELERALREVDFDKDSDILFCAGDIVDRGPESHLAAEYIGKHWFWSTLGNHCEHVIKYKTVNTENWYSRGGSWHSKLSEQEKQDWAILFSMLPICIEVITDNGRYGVVHADIPVSDWNELQDSIIGVDAVNLKTIKNRLNCVLYSRHRFEQTGKGLGGDSCEIAGIDHLYFGHCCVPHPMTRGNCTWIDTFGETGKFTIMRLI